MRKKQKGAERRRGLAIVGVCVLVAVLIVGAAAFQPIKDWWDLRQYNGIDLADDRRPGLGLPEGHDQDGDGNQEHVPTGHPVDYDDAPPAFGQHWNERASPDPMARKFYTAEDRPELGTLVHNLEHGYTILWYDETVADDSDAMNADARRSPTSSPAPPTCATSSRPCRGPRGRGRQDVPRRASTSRSRTGRPAAPASTDADEAGRRLAVLLRRLAARR